MRIMKKVTLLFVVLALFVGVMPTFASAEDNTRPIITFSQEDPDGVYDVGDTFAVNVSITNNTGFNNFTFRLAFDTNTFKLLSTEPVGNTSSWTSFKTTAKLKFYGATGTTGIVTDDCVFAKLTFEVLSKESDSFSIGLNTSEYGCRDIGLNTSGGISYELADSDVVPCTVNVGTSSSVSVESVALDQQTLTLTAGDTATLTATVLPEDATNQNVTWASDNEEVAKVENGVVTAVAGGTANITVTTEDGEKTATCEVTVNAKQPDVPDVPEVKTGYTMSLPAGTTPVQPGESVQVDVTVGVGTEEIETAYNAVDMTITYDAEKLTFEKDSSALPEGSSVTDANGAISLKRFGGDLMVNEDKFTLVFTANEAAGGDAAITVTSAFVDKKELAGNDAPAATIVNATHTVRIESGYQVTFVTTPANLSEVTGAATAQAGQAYTFTLEPLANYDYAVTATVDGNEVPCTLDGTTYTIPAASVTGDITVTVIRTAKQYTVTLDGTGKDDAKLSAEQATYGTDYTFTVTKETGYTYTVSAKVGDETLNLTSTNEGNVYTYTIPGDKITGDVSVTVTKTKDTPPVPSTFDVTWDGNALDDVPTKADKANQGEDFTFTVNTQDGYTYEVTATVSGEARDVNVDGDTYTISHINGAVVITVNRTAESKLAVEVAEYVKQDGKNVYLITAADTSLAEGKLLAYDGANMFYSAKYNAYCYLVISTEGLEAVKADAEEKIAQADGNAIEIGYTGDVNGTGKIDINDAQMAYNMYGSELYNDFEKATMKMYLEADMTGDKKIDVSDAAAIVDIIK